MPRQRLTYDQWKGAVNAAVLQKVGLSADDLPDWNYRDAYEEGMSPLRAAAKVIKNAMEG